MVALLFMSWIHFYMVSAFCLKMWNFESAIMLSGF